MGGSDSFLAYFRTLNQVYSDIRQCFQMTRVLQVVFNQKNYELHGLKSLSVLSNCDWNFKLKIINNIVCIK